MRKSFIVTHSKAKDWSYEEEYRLTKVFPSPTPDDSPDRKVRIDDSAIREIIIGLNTPSEVEEEIVEIGMRKEIKVYKAYKVPFKFRINRYEKNLHATARFKS
jgi:predicted transcriptional regulator with HTH domain